jgi:hypothetical protein
LPTTKSQHALGFGIDIVPVISSTTELRPGAVFDALRDRFPAPAKPARKPRKSSVAALVKRAEKTGKTVTSITTPDGITIRFDELTPGRDQSVARRSAEGEAMKLPKFVQAWADDRDGRRANWDIVASWQKSSGSCPRRLRLVAQKALGRSRISNSAWLGMDCRLTWSAPSQGPHQPAPRRSLWCGE